MPVRVLVVLLDENIELDMELIGQGLLVVVVVVVVGAAEVVSVV